MNRDVYKSFSRTKILRLLLCLTCISYEQDHTTTARHQWKLCGQSAGAAVSTRDSSNTIWKLLLFQLWYACVGLPGPFTV